MCSLNLSVLDFILYRLQAAQPALKSCPQCQASPGNALLWCACPGRRSNIQPGTKEVWDKYMSKYKAAALGISGM